MSILPKCTETALPKLPAEWQLVAVAVLADGKLALLASSADLEHEWRRDPNGLVLGKPWEVATRAKARLWCFDGEKLVDGPSFLLETPFPNIDRFDDGRWLVVARRTRGEPNARILASDGQLLIRFMVGDGIEHAGVDRRDRIWVGWFDEGVFGNGEWRVPNEEWPPSSNGIGLFSADGAHQKLPPFPKSAGPVADCYALNITAEGAWACAYVDFPLMQLEPGASVRWWKNEVSGARALAVHKDNALLAGGYGADADRIALIKLEGEGDGCVARTVATWRLPLLPQQPQSGELAEMAKMHPWQYPVLLTGRDDTIHLV